MTLKLVLGNRTLPADLMSRAKDLFAEYGLVYDEPHFQLLNKVAIVTGGSNGIGKAIVKAYLKEGAKVVMADIDEDAGYKLEKEMRELGFHKLRFIPTDLTREEAIDNLVTNTIEAYGRVDILVNNAGVNLPGSIEETDKATWDLTFAVNVTAPFLLCKHVIPYMKRQGGGRIINMASANSLVAEPHQSPYTSSKGSTTMFTKQLALDYAKHNILVNCICPGWVNTTINDRHANLMFGENGREKVLEILPDIQPIGRPIEPEEVADSAVFLAGPRSTAITGSSLVIDGGVTIQ